MYFFSQMWSNVAWNALDPNDIIHSAPKDIGLFAEGLTQVVAHLVTNYTCIDFICITNEPGDTWSWWQDEKGQPISITPALKAVKESFDAHNIKVPISAPDMTDLPGLFPGNIDYDQYIGAYDLHSYWAQFDYATGGYPLSSAEQTMRSWAKFSNDRKKPFLLTEFGSMAYGWGGSDPGPGTYNASLKDAELVVRGINAGTNALSRWNFINRGNLDGQWQFLDTWDPINNKLLPPADYAPHPNSYFVVGLFMRFTAKDSTVVSVNVTGGTMANHQRVFASGLVSPKKQITILVVNDAFNDWPIHLSFKGLTMQTMVHSYRVSEKDQNNPQLQINPLKSWNVDASTGLSDTLTARSVSVYTTYLLNHNDPGIIVG